MKYCPKCKSKLYPADEKHIEKYGICSYCTTFWKKVANPINLRKKEVANET